MITKLVIENYKSIEKAELTFSKINVLIGPNGSGKSSVLESVELLLAPLFGNSHFTNGVYVMPMDYEHFRELVFWKDTTRGISVNLRVTLPVIDYIKAYMKVNFKKREYGTKLEYPSDYHFSTQDKHPRNLLKRFLHILRTNRNIQRILSGVLSDPEDVTATNAHQLFYYTCYRSEFQENIQIIKEFYSKYKLFNVRWVPTRTGSYEIVATTSEGIDVNLVDIGSGLSSLFPIVVALSFYPEGSTIFIEHPEMHLHPKLQYELANFLLDVSKKRKYQLVLETHSEHLLYGLLNAVASKKLEPEEFFIYSSRKEEGKSIFEKLKVNEDGSIEGNLQDFLEANLDAFLDWLKA